MTPPPRPSQPMPMSLGLSAGGERHQQQSPAQPELTTPSTQPPSLSLPPSAVGVGAASPQYQQWQPPSLSLPPSAVGVGAASPQYQQWSQQMPWQTNAVANKCRGNKFHLHSSGQFPPPKSRKWPRSRGDNLCTAINTVNVIGVSECHNTDEEHLKPYHHHQVHLTAPKCRRSHSLSNQTNVVGVRMRGPQ